MILAQSSPSARLHFFVRHYPKSKSFSFLEKVLFIEGMVCGNCVKHVHKALTELAGVQEAVVELESKTAKVRLDNSVSDDTLKAAVEDAGYTLVSIQETA